MSSLTAASSPTTNGDVEVGSEMAKHNSRGYIVLTAHALWPSYIGRFPETIREIPDHATFREKGHTLGWLDKLGGLPSLTLRNLANFDQL